MVFRACLDSNIHRKKMYIEPPNILRECVTKQTYFNQLLNK